MSRSWMPYLGGAHGGVHDGVHDGFHDGVHGEVHDGVHGVAHGAVVEVHCVAGEVHSAVGGVHDAHSSPSARTAQRSQRLGPSRSLVDRLDHETGFLVERGGT